jgi:hypothetical protein
MDASPRQDASPSIKSRLATFSSCLKGTFVFRDQAFSPVYGALPRRKAGIDQGF